MYRAIQKRWPFGHKKSVWKDEVLHQGLWTLGGIGLGAGLMYLLDPDRGRRRRALVREKIASGVNKSGEMVGALGSVSRDLGNRTKGMVANVKSRFSSDDVSDEILEARVRAELGRAVSHPGDIIVTADEGRVTLSGRVSPEEEKKLVSCVSSVRGVREVTNLVMTYDQMPTSKGMQGV